MKTWLKWSIGAACAVGLTVVVGGQLIKVAADEGNSEDRFSDSAVEAERTHLLIQRVVATPSQLEWGGAQIRVREAWIERVTRVTYRWFVFRQTIPTGRYRLVLSVAPVDTAHPPSFTALAGAEWLGFDDSLRFQSWVDGRYWLRSVELPFPDTIHLGIIKLR